LEKAAEPYKELLNVEVVRKAEINDLSNNVSKYQKLMESLNDQYKLPTTSNDSLMELYETFGLFVQKSLISNCFENPKGIDDFMKIMLRDTKFDKSIKGFTNDLEDLYVFSVDEERVLMGKMDNNLDQLIAYAEGREFSN
jgi:hypothetical protein